MKSNSHLATMKSRHFETEGYRTSLVLTALGLCFCTFYTFAAPPPASVTNIQPVTAPAEIDEIYEPTALVSFIYAEPVAYPGLPIEGFRLNADIEVKNTGPVYLHMEQLSALTTFEHPQVVLTGHELLELPEWMLTESLGPADLRRSMLANGGFGVTGLMLEQRIGKSDSLPFGEGLDVIPFETDKPDSYRVGYIVSGSHQFLIGDPPVSSDDSLPSIGRQGFVAMYDSMGNIKAHLYTVHDEISALADLGDGRILMAGRYEVFSQSDVPRRLAVTRATIWEKNEDGDKVNLEYIDPDSDFGITENVAGTVIAFHDGITECDVRRATMVAPANGTQSNKLSKLGPTSYVIAAELLCGKKPKIGIAVLDQSGALVEKFGSGGMKVYSGPKGQAVIPVGVAHKKKGPIFAYGPSKGLINDSAEWIWLGAALGNGCSGNGSEDCEFALNAFDLANGELQTEKWFKASPLSNSEATRPYDFALDKSGRPIMAGVSWEYDTRFVAVHRFTTKGTSDNSFGLTGWYISNFMGHEGAAHGVQPTSDGSIALAIFSLEDGGAAGVIPSLAMAKISGDGAPIWESSPYEAGQYFTHSDVTRSTNYGYVYEPEMTSAPAQAIIEDWNGRYVIAGRASSAKLNNPCEQAAEDLDDPFLDLGPQCGGPLSVAVARYLPFGEPDSRRWVAPGTTRKIRIPEDRDLGHFAPPMADIRVMFDGYDPLVIIRDMTAFSNAIQNVTVDSYGSYRFPFAPWVLDYHERFSVRTHTLDHHHRNSPSNRFAYDISIKRWTGSGWTHEVSDPIGGANTDHLAWLRQVRAVAPGHVVSCRRGEIDTTPGAYNGNEANYVKIQHTYDPFDSSKVEYISYLHFAQNTVPIEVCPDIDGEDPDGAELPDPVQIEAGQLLGLVGSSGNSSGPHLHIHLTTRADEEVGPEAGSYPLLFHDVSIQSSSGTPDDAVYEVNGRAIAHDSLAYPTD